MQAGYFGSAIAIFNDTLVVGAPGVNTSSGAAYVFFRTAGTWLEQAKIEAGNSLPIFAAFGSAVAISGDTIVIGVPYDGPSQGFRPGSAYVFVRNGATWFEEQVLTASEGEDSDEFGRSVAVSGDVIMIGAPHHEHSGSTAGAAYVFMRNGAAWSESQILVSSDLAPGDSFGGAVAMSEDTVVIGASRDDQGNKSDSGSAYVFVRNGATWVEQQKLKTKSGSYDYFGTSVAIDGDTCLLGAPGEDKGGVDVGSSYVFIRNGTTWSEQQEVSTSNLQGLDKFGTSVAVSGNLAVIGAHRDDSPGSMDHGSAYLYARSGTIWIEQAELLASDGDEGDLFGVAACVLGDTAIIAANSDEYSPLLIFAGSAYVFQLSQAQSMSYCTAGTSAGGCLAKIGADGIPSATASAGFFLSATGVEGAKSGRFAYGTGGQQGIPWGNGTSFQCIVPPTVGSGLLVVTGTNGACDGSVSQDLNSHWCPTCPKPNHNPGAGAVVQAQLWYRDPLNTSNQTTSLSDAIEFVVGP
jgi:hypothetical protein